MKPKDEKQLAEAVRSATAPFELLGSGTKRALGRPVQAQQLDLSAFQKIIAYEPEELILECGTATSLSEIEKLLVKNNQMLAFEPPNYSDLLESSGGGTVGGALMCNLAGPRRMKAGAARDHILGVSGVNGMGEIIKAGARVVKNVTGYDVPRLLAGSYGTLMALTSIIFKVLPRPEMEMTVYAKTKTLEDALNLMTQSLQSSAEVSSAAFVPGQGAYLRLEGIAPSVKFRRDLLVKLLKANAETLDDAQSKAFWSAMRDVAPLQRQKASEIWRVSLPPSDAPRFVNAVAAEDFFCDWAGGLIWLAARPGQDIRGHLTHGHATLFHANAERRAVADVFQPQPPQLAALSSRVKAAFDPKGLFNPGRMYRDI